MSTHWHFSIENTLFYALTTALWFHILRLASGYFAQHGSNKLGTAVGAVFTFP